MFDIIAIGGATLDFFVESSKDSIMEFRNRDGKKEYFCLGYGDKVEIEKSSFDIGGGAVNTAASFAKQGFSTSLLVKTGSGHISEYLLSKVHRRNIDTSCLIKSKEHRTGFSIILTSFEGDRTVLMQRGANSTLAKNDIDWDALANTKAIYCSSLSNDSEKVLPDIADFCHQKNIIFACNPGGITIREGMDAKIDSLSKMNILFLNKREASDFTGIVEKFDKNNDDGINFYIKEMLVNLKKYVKDIVVITDGKKGVYVHDGHKFYYAKPYPAKVVSTLGAGDAFASTFFGTLLKTDDIKKAIAFASINSASVVSEYGAQRGLKTHEELCAIYEKADIEIFEN